MEKTNLLIQVGNITLIEARSREYKAYDGAMAMSYKADIVVNGMILTDFKITKEVFDNVKGQKMILGTDAVMAMTAYKGTPDLKLTGFKSSK